MSVTVLGSSLVMDGVYKEEDSKYLSRLHVKLRGENILHQTVGPHQTRSMSLLILDSSTPELKSKFFLFLGYIFRWCQHLFTCRRLWCICDSKLSPSWLRQVSLECNTQGDGKTDRRFGLGFRMITSPTVAANLHTEDRVLSQIS